MKRPQKKPERMCVGCREMKEKKTLLRIVRDPQGHVTLDMTGKKSGRGAYICSSRECFEKAVKTKALSRALDCYIAPEVIQEIQTKFQTEEP